MRRLLVVVVVALAFAGAGHAAAAPVPDSASAFYVVNASNGEVLASHNAHASLPIASITKLMTVIVALAAPEAERRGHGLRRGRRGRRVADPAARGTSESRVRDLLAGALIQSANNAADALASAAVRTATSRASSRG